MLHVTKGFMNHNTPINSWKRLFADPASWAWIIIALLSLTIFSSILLSRVSTSPQQKIILITLAIVSMWQMIRQKKIDTVTLLLGLLGTFILQSLHKAEAMSALSLMLYTSLLATLLTLWQGHLKFDKALLWRHAYLIGLISGQVGALLTYFVIYDDLLAKSIIWTITIYVWWGLLDLTANKNIRFASFMGYISLSMLLVGLVLVTIKPIQ